MDSGDSLPTSCADNSSVFPSVIVPESCCQIRCCSSHLKLATPGCSPFQAVPRCRCKIQGSVGGSAQAARNPSHLVFRRRLCSGPQVRRAARRTHAFLDHRQHCSRSLCFRRRKCVVLWLGEMGSFRSPLAQQGRRRNPAKSRPPRQPHQQAIILGRQSSRSQGCCRHRQKGRLSLGHWTRALQRPCPRCCPDEGCCSSHVVQGTHASSCLEACPRRGHDSVDCSLRVLGLGP